MKKKFLTALLTVTMFTCALMTGCGSKNEVAEPKNDKEVVTEESNVEESNVDETVSEENNTNNEENNVADEDTIEELSFADLWTLASDCSENQPYSFNTDGSIVIFNMKAPASEGFDTDFSTFDMYVVDTSTSRDNLKKGCISYWSEEIAEDNTARTVEKWKTTIGGVGLFTDYESTYDSKPPVIETSEEPWLEGATQSTQTLELRYIDENADNVADKIAFTYNDNGETHIIGYANPETGSTFGEHFAGKFCRFETQVSENGEDFVYYTLLEVPKSLRDREINFVLGTNDEMMAETNVNALWSN